MTELYFKSLKKLLIAVLSIILFTGCTRQQQLFFDDFSSYPDGRISSPVGAHTEYHYLKEAQLNPVWQVTSFYHNPRGSDTAWRIEAFNGKKVMSQTIPYKLKFTHLMVVAGNPLWSDYSASVEFSPLQTGSRAGMIFRYQNDRQYYFFGMEKNALVLMKVNHEKAFHTPDETILDSVSFQWQPGEVYYLSADLRGNKINASLNGNPLLQAEDSSFQSGKIALMADLPARFFTVEVNATQKEVTRIEKDEEQILADERQLQEANPKPVVWKRISTKGFGVGRNLRFGDLNNDSQTDVLIGQVIHHAWPRDSYSELSCLTAMTFDGDRLWQIGTPSPDHTSLTNDVALQIYDLDNDGRNEVIYTMNGEIIVADAASGKTKFKKPTPAFESIQYATDSKTEVVRKWDRILGDCLFICNLRGLDRPSDLVIKDRYTHFWVLDEKLNIQWSAACRTGHYPFARDTDQDGKEELFIGYSCFNGKGEKLWSLDDTLKDHCDGVAVARFKDEYKLFIAGSDQGAIVTDIKGNVEKIHLVGHVQNPAVANFRSDLPGLETVSVNFWGNQGIIHFYDANHNIYHSIEPTPYGSMCLPINWTGREEELFVLNASVREGGMYDGWGRKVVQFPDDGHPDICNAVLDLTGDQRDEVVVWDPEQIWVYTQSDSPKTGPLLKVKRNALYNYSNYQATVSEPVEIEEN